MAALKYWVWLQTLHGVSDPLKLALLEHFSSPEEVYFADEEAYLRVEGITKQNVLPLLGKSMAVAEKVLSDCARAKIFIITMDDALYPDRLRNIYDPPILLYGKGKMPLFDEEVALAMVGTRRCTPYGVRVAEEMGYGLARQGAVVVSGLARGVDAAALRGAIRGGGFPVAVLGGGADVIYPAENRSLYEDIAATGVLLTEYPPHTEPEGWHFPIRNRILSGLCLGTVVVEAPRERSGALITAHAAAEQGKDVFAVPGPIDAPMSQGCLQLIREGATLVGSAWDVLEEYAPRYPHKIRQNEAQLPLMPAGAPETEKPVKSAVEEPEEKPPRPILDISDCGLDEEQLLLLRQISPETPSLSDDIAERAGLSIHRALSALTLLEISGYIVKSGARSFLRTVDIKEGIEDSK